MPGEISRFHPEVPQHDPEYIEVNEHEQQIEAIGEALSLARSLLS
jgi:hypothetical protein